MSQKVFTKKTQIKTDTEVPQAGADNHISIKDSTADWSAITTESFLPDPKPGQDQVLVRSGHQTSKVAEGQSLNEVQQKLWMHVYDQDEVRELEQNRKTQINQNETVTVLGSREVKVRQNIDESAGQNIAITAGMTLTLKGPGGIIKIDQSGITIQGTLVKINC